MKIRAASCVLLPVFSLTFYVVAAAQPVVEHIDRFSAIDWSQRVVRAYGSSTNQLANSDRSKRIETLEAAKADAVRKLHKAIRNIVLNRSATIAGVVAEDAVFQRQIQKFVQGYTITDTRSMSDMSVEVEVQVPIPGGLMDLILPDLTGKGALRLDDTPRSPLGYLPWPECRAVPEGVELIIPSQGLVSYHGDPYTGLIIDARGLAVQPALLPRILNEAGEEIYGVRYVGRDAAVENGLAAYRKTMQEALRDGRAGSEPFVICATQASGKTKTDVVVSANDAVLIHAAAVRHNFLRTCRVVFVIGPEPH